MTDGYNGTKGFRLHGHRHGELTDPKQTDRSFTSNQKNQGRFGRMQLSRDNVQFDPVKTWEQPRAQRDARPKTRS